MLAEEVGELLADAPSLTETPACCYAARAAGGATEPSSGVVSRGVEQQQQQQQAASQRLGPSRLQHETPAAQPAAVAAAGGRGGGRGVGAGPGPLIQLSPFDAAAPSSSYDDLNWDDDTPLFLDSCRFVLMAALGEAPQCANVPPIPACSERIHTLC